MKGQETQRESKGKERKQVVNLAVSKDADVVAVEGALHQLRDLLEDVPLCRAGPKHLAGVTHTSTYVDKHKHTEAHKHEHKTHTHTHTRTHTHTHTHKGRKKGRKEKK
jgi:hypothetical protein